MENNLKGGKPEEMRKLFLTMVPVILMLFLVLPTGADAAVADGTYNVNYQVNKPGSSSASMANDYFLKPAKLTVGNGKMTIQLTIKNSSWVTQFNPPGGASVVSSNAGADQRVVQFSIGSLNPLTVGMKIDIEDIDYHHAYSVDFVFDGSGLPEAKPQQEATPPATAPSNNAETKPNPNPSQSSGSNTSSNKQPATTSGKEGAASTTEQSKPAQNVAGADTSQETAENPNQQEVTQTEEVENPETSDALPLASLAAFMAAAIIFIRTKQAKTN
jgi:heme uptake protein IsdC